MKKKIQVSVGSVAQALDRFEQAWRQAEKGDAPPAQVRLSFESLPTLLKNIGSRTPAVGASSRISIDPACADEPVTGHSQNTAFFLGPSKLTVGIFPTRF